MGPLPFSVQVFVSAAFSRQSRGRYRRRSGRCARSDLCSIFRWLRRAWWGSPFKDDLHPGGHDRLALLAGADALGDASGEEVDDLVLAQIPGGEVLVVAPELLGPSSETAMRDSSSRPSPARKASSMSRTERPRASISTARFSSASVRPFGAPALPRAPHAQSRREGARRADERAAAREAREEQPRRQPAAMNISCPASAPRLNATSASGTSPSSRPSSWSARTKPSPCSTPKRNATVQGKNGSATRSLSRRSARRRGPITRQDQAAPHHREGCRASQKDLIRPQGPAVRKRAELIELGLI